MDEMLKTYELALKIMRFYDDLDPWGISSDEFGDAFNGTVDILLDGKKQQFIDEINEWDFEPGEMYYDEAKALIAAVNEYEAPELWWKD